MSVIPTQRNALNPLTLDAKLIAAKHLLLSTFLLLSIKQAEKDKYANFTPSFLSSIGCKFY